MDSHGRDADYYQHRIQGVPFPEDSGGAACGCRKAHAEAETRRAANRTPRRRGSRVMPRTKQCPDCETPITERAERCRSCALQHAWENRVTTPPPPPPPIRWVRRGLIWKAVA